MTLYAAKAIPIGTLTGTGQFVLTGQLRLRGFGLNNTSAVNTAEVDLYDGEGSGGQLICKVNLAASESTRADGSTTRLRRIRILATGRN